MEEEYLGERTVQVKNAYKHAAAPARAGKVSGHKDCEEMNRVSQLTYYLRTSFLNEFTYLVYWGVSPSSILALITATPPTPPTPIFLFPPEFVVSNDGPSASESSSGTASESSSGTAEQLFWHCPVTSLLQDAIVPTLNWAAPGFVAPDTYFGHAINLVRTLVTKHRIALLACVHAVLIQKLVGHLPGVGPKRTAQILASAGLPVHTKATAAPSTALGCGNAGGNADDNADFSSEAVAVPVTVPVAVPVAVPKEAQADDDGDGDGDDDDDAAPPPPCRKKRVTVAVTAAKSQPRLRIKYLTRYRRIRTVLMEALDVWFELNSATRSKRAGRTCADVNCPVFYPFPVTWKWQWWSDEDVVAMQAFVDERAARARTEEK